MSYSFSNENCVTQVTEPCEPLGYNAYTQLSRTDEDENEKIEENSLAPQPEAEKMLEENYNEQVREALRAWLALPNHSYALLIGRTGLNLQTIVALLKGKHNPTRSTLVRLARAGVNIPKPKPFVILKGEPAFPPPSRRRHPATGLDKFAKAKTDREKENKQLDFSQEEYECIIARFGIGWVKDGLVEWLTQPGHSKNELTNRSGISRGTILRILSGKSSKLETVKKLLQADILPMPPGAE